MQQAMIFVSPPFLQDWIQRKGARENNFKLYKSQDESKQAKIFPFPIKIGYKENHKRTATSTS